MTAATLPTTAPTKGDTAWFTHDRFGLFIHWGIYSAAARHEWVKQRERITDERLPPYFDHFDPDLYDPRLGARRQGRRHEIRRHHQQAPRRLLPLGLRPHRLQGDQHPGGRDLIGPWVEAFRAEGLKVGFYHSVIDWHHPDFTIDGSTPSATMRRSRAAHAGTTRHLEIPRIPPRPDPRAPHQLRQDRHHLVRLHLLQGVGRQGPRRLALGRARRDGARSPARHPHQRPHRPPRKSRLHHPGAVPTQGWMERDGKRVVWEACQTLNGAWGYDRDNLDWKSPELLVRLLIDSVAKGGNVLLNVGPTARGEFEPRARADPRRHRRVDPPPRPLHLRRHRQRSDPAARLPLHPARQPPLPPPLRLALPPRPPRRPRRPRRVRPVPQRRLRDQDASSTTRISKPKTRPCPVTPAPSRWNCRSNRPPASSSP